MADYLIHDSTLEDIADAIRAKTGGSSLIAPEDMPSEIASISSGTSITDGIIVKSRDANSNPSEVDFYGSIVKDYQFGFNGYGTRCNPFSLVSKVNFKSEVPRRTVISLFANAINIKSLAIPENVSFDISLSFANSCTELETVNILSQSRIVGYTTFANNPKLKTFYAPKMTYVNATSSKTHAMFLSCPLLESVQFGSIGYGVTLLTSAVFNNEQSNLIITIYTTGSYVDTAVANTRNGATNATIIIKASEETTYNGTTYAAGATILTSEVT